MRFISTFFALTALTTTAHAMLPTPEVGEVSYTNAGRVVAVTPQNTPIHNPLAQASAQPQLATKAQAMTMPSVPAPVSFGTPNTPTMLSQAPVQAPVQFANPILSNQYAPQAGIDSVVNAFIVQNMGGQETLVPVNIGTTVKSGDILEYQGLFTNNSGERVRRMDLTLSIANGLEFIGNVNPKNVQASLDNSRFVRMPIRANIGGQIQEVSLSQYKALKWTVEEIGLGATAVVKYRARVK